MPELAPVSSRRGVDIYDVDIREGLADILPGFQTPIYGYEGVYPGPTIRARKGRTAMVRQHDSLGFDTNVHLHGGTCREARRPPDGRHPAGREVRLHVPERPGRGVPLVHDHAHGRNGRRSTTASSARTCSTTRSSRSSSCRMAIRCPLVMRTTRSTATGRSLRRERRPRLPRRHDSRQRRRLPADAGRAADLPPPHPQRVQRTLLRAQLGRGLRDLADRQRRRPAGACGQRRSAGAAHPAERVELLIDFASSGPAPSWCCTTRRARRATVP